MLDRRRKLTDEQRDEIKALYAKGRSKRSLGKQYGVYDSTIDLIINPEKHLAKRRSIDWSQYICHEKHALVMREHRRYKHDCHHTLHTPR